MAFRNVCYQRIFWKTSWGKWRWADAQSFSMTAQDKRVLSVPGLRDDTWREIRDMKYGIFLGDEIGTTLKVVHGENFHKEFMWGYKTSSFQAALGIRWMLHMWQDSAVKDDLHTTSRRAQNIYWDSTKVKLRRGRLDIAPSSCFTGILLAISWERRSLRAMQSHEASTRCFFKLPAARTFVYESIQSCTSQSPGFLFLTTGEERQPWMCFLTPTGEEQIPRTGGWKRESRLRPV